MGVLIIPSFKSRYTLWHMQQLRLHQSAITLVKMNTVMDKQLSTFPSFSNVIASFTMMLCFTSCLFFSLLVLLTLYEKSVQLLAGRLQCAVHHHSTVCTHTTF